MCTLITVNQTFYFGNKQEVTAQILSDSQYNSDGWSLICVDPMALYGNVAISAMNIGIILSTIENFMLNSSPYGRFFLHSRAATTDSIGIEFNHGFTDSRGTMIQHNGVIRNYRNLGVDSFNLVDYRTENAEQFADDLETAMETWVNAFLIRPDLNTYGVVHMLGGTLYKDYLGNYSTNPIGTININTPMAYAREHTIRPVIKTNSTPVPATSMDAYEKDDFEEFYKQQDSAWDSVADKYRVK